MNLHLNYFGLWTKAESDVTISFVSIVTLNINFNEEIFTSTIWKGSILATKIVLLYFF